MLDGHTARFGRSFNAVDPHERKGPSSEFLLISDGIFFKTPSILAIFPTSGAGTRGASLKPVILLYMPVAAIVLQRRIAEGAH